MQNSERPQRTMRVFCASILPPRRAGDLLASRRRASKSPLSVRRAATISFGDSSRARRARPRGPSRTPCSPVIGEKDFTRVGEDLVEFLLARLGAEMRHLIDDVRPLLARLQRLNHALDGVAVAADLEQRALPRAVGKPIRRGRRRQLRRRRGGEDGDHERGHEHGERQRASSLA